MDASARLREVAAAASAYDATDVDVDKPLKKPQQIEAMLASRVAWGDIAPLLFFGTSDGTLHSYVPSAGAQGSASVSYLRAHTAYKKVFHACAQFLDSWGVFLTLVDTKMTLYALPLQSNPQLDGNAAASLSSLLYGRSGGAGRNSIGGGVMNDKMVVMDDTKQTTLLAAHEGAKVVCALTKQQTLRVYDWTVNRSLELRTQHELPLLFAALSEANSTSSLLSPSALPIQQLIVLSESHVFLLLKKSWCVINVDSGKVIEMQVKDGDAAAAFANAGADTIACAIALPSRHRQQAHHPTNDVFLAGKHSAVIVSLAADNEDEEEETIIDAKLRANPHNLSDDRVRVKVQRVLEYNVAPRAAYYHHPLLLLDQQDKLIVYNFGSMRLMQTIPNKATLFGAAVCHVGDAANAIVAVTASPFAMQMHTRRPLTQLVEHAKAVNRLEDAVALCKLSPDDVNVNDDELQSLYASYAMELFTQKRAYNPAMSLFLESGCRVMDVLVALYPRDLLPRSASSSANSSKTSWSASATSTAADLKGDDLVRSLLALILFLRCKRDAVATTYQRALGATQRHKNNETNKDNERELIDTVLLKCLVLICETNEEKYAATAKRELLALVSAPDNACEMGEAELFLRSHCQWNALLAFYGARKQHRKALELLEDLERTATTAASDKDAKATTIAAGAATFGREELQTSEAYMVLITSYLQRLGHKKAELVFEFSRRVLAVRPTLGLTIFTKRNVREQKEDLDPSLVLSHLKTCELPSSASSETDQETTTLPLIDARFLAIEYLTQAIANGAIRILPRLHDEVVYLLLDAITTQLQHQGSSGRLTSRVRSQRGLIGTLRRKLLAFLEAESSAYHPERMLSRTPMDMVDERAALLSRLGRHHEVLQLYAIELQDASLAEAYCNRCYEAKLADSSIYSALLRLYLRPQHSSPLAAPRSASTGVTGGSSSPAPPPIKWQRSSSTSHLLHGSAGSSNASSEAVAAAVSILNKYPERIDVPTALELLPPDVPVASLSFFFRRVLERQVERFRNGQVKKQLSKMENFKTREVLANKRKASVTVWSSHCCSVCSKRIGTGTFVRLPNGALLHYACQPAAA
uniref:CNH domain-containing protein n=1 Tax=Globisporangium ultimum (strain ATCC 200006 / CBS 805.95 / DAOM BR144) TaxID=431595 RepID=K3WM53_GLOUD